MSACIMQLLDMGDCAGGFDLRVDNINAEFMELSDGRGRGPLSVPINYKNNLCVGMIDCTL
jgi:hypothetical protein